MSWKQRTLGLLLISLLPSFAIANVIVVANDEQLKEALFKPKPGLTILISPGKYKAGILVTDLHGKPDQTITIKAEKPNIKPVFQSGRHGLQFSKASYLVIDGIKIQNVNSNGLNIDDGGDRNHASHHITLRNVEVMNIGQSGGNLDGIKLSGVDDFKIENCLLWDWGSGGSAIDMVGCHNGMIKECYFSSSKSVSGNGVQAKGGSSNIEINGCRFEQAGARAINLGGSTGKDYFRPEGVRYEAKDLMVKDCVFIGSHAPIAFVGVDGAKAIHNTIFLPDRYVVRILQENRSDGFTPCRNGIFQNNLIVYDPQKVSISTNIGPGTEPKSFNFTGNAWVSLSGKGRIKHEISDHTEIKLLNVEFQNAAEFDLRLKNGEIDPIVGSQNKWALSPLNNKKN